MAPTTPSTHVVIIGASFAGAGVAHKLLESPSVKVTLINPAETFYFNIAAPRVLAKPAQNSLDKILVPIASAFTKYPTANFEFIVGSVTAINVVQKSVTTTVGAAEKKSISYDYLVVASGSQTAETTKENGITFKPTGANDLHASIEKSQKCIAAAKSIIIAGGGAVGVETAGEIAEAYPGTQVTLLSAGPRVLDFMKESASKMAKTNLTGLGVHVVDSKRKEDGVWEVTLSDGKTKTADLYIAATGLLPNSAFMPQQYLDADGWVKVTSMNTVEGITDGSVYAIGDVTALTPRFAMRALSQIPTVAANIKASIAGGKGKTEYKPSTMVMAFVPTGSKSGTGQVSGFVVYSFMVAFVKGKDFFISKAGSFIGLK